MYNRSGNSFSLRNINPGESFYSVQIVNSVAHKRDPGYEEALTVDDNTGTYALMLNDGMRDFAGSHHRVLDT
jgi:hypothetical protein